MLTGENNEKYELLERNNKEQEKLIKGYQLENERLYTEIKCLKDNLKLESKKLSEEIKMLKCDLIQEKMNNEKHVKQVLHEPVPLANKILDSGNKRVIPTIDESLPALNSHSEYEAEIKFLNGKLAHLNAENSRLNVQSLELGKKVDFFNKNQRQIDLDVNVIRGKNKDIKKLTDKIKLLENGKIPVDCLREQKVMKNQLKEMDLLVKRLRKGHSNIDSDSNR